MVCRPSSAPEWVSDFYDRKGQLSGPSGVLDHHRERAAAIERFAGKSSGRVLELGAGAGGSAVATAKRGYEVVAVELSTVRTDFAKDLSSRAGRLELDIIHGDFMQVEIPGRFDAVTYWNGFGVGSDHDQRALLHKIAEDWLTQDGVAVLDVFNPLAWCREAGTMDMDLETNRRQAIDFDAVTSRMVDTWWFDGDDEPPLSQSQRCYSPADLALLLEGTGLTLLQAEVDGTSLEALGSGVDGPLGNAWGYRVLLGR